ncbi:putative secreted protein [Rhodopirellula maiorica SM1]|uniref:Putative secreted protein n=1 Tax=Rhodopirellula maiorica SM1 TaxID=1265738 RepID=M5RC00_9BACT|nr:hypothetical protein [Rhodopirellula maiorica]EMI16905.1 putative secreted protein [Rhodopirellula maiorica SM1]
MNFRSSRRRFLAAGLATTGYLALNVPLFAADHEITQTQSQSLIDNLVNFLRQQQSANGAWKSRTYALLKSGQALTPFVLSALLGANPKIADTAMAEKAIAWMRGKIRGGALGVADPDVLEYPVFASGFALRCFQDCSGDKETIVSLRVF